MFALFLILRCHSSATHPRGPELEDHTQGQKYGSGFQTVCQGTAEVLFRSRLIDEVGEKDSISPNLSWT